MPVKFVTVNDNGSASGGLRPQDSLPGLRAWTPLGDFRRPDPLACAVLKFPLKISCYRSIISQITLEVVPLRMTTIPIVGITFDGQSGLYAGTCA